MTDPTLELLKVEAFRDGRLDACIEVIAVLDAQISTKAKAILDTGPSGNDRLDTILDAEKKVLEQIRIHVLALKAEYGN